MSNPDYGALVAELRALPEGDGSRVVLVVGAVHGEGVTTVARGLAAALVMHDEGRVFVVDAGSQVTPRRSAGSLRSGTESAGKSGSGDEPRAAEGRGDRGRRKKAEATSTAMSKAGREAEEADAEVLYQPVKMDADGAYRGVVTLPALSPPEGRIDFLYKRKLEGAFAEFKNEFEWIIIDAPPVTVYPEFAVLASLADATLMVVKAESTRWEVADRARRIIERAGGTLLGAVLSQRQYHIPDAVYRRL